MSVLTTRAEQGLLGAILRDGGRGDELPAAQVLLETGDFGHRAHQQVWTALVDLQTNATRLAGQQLLDAVAERLNTPGADRAWLERLRDAGAQRRHLPSYIRMIQTAALRREIASTAERLTTEGGDSRLAEALQRQVRAHEAVTTDTPTRSVGSVGSVRSVGFGAQETVTANGNTTSALAPSQDRAPEPQTPQPQTPRTPAPSRAVQPPVDGRGTSRAEREDLLLADLLRNPEQAAELARTFPAETLTDPQRREVFRSVVAIAADGDPVDSVIVAVDIERQRAYAKYLTDPSDILSTEPPIEPADPGTEPAPAYLNRLAQLGIETATEVIAVEIARDLMSDDVRTRLANHAARVTPQPRTQPQPAAETITGTQGRRDQQLAQTQPVHRPPEPMPLLPPQHRPGPPQAPDPAPRIQP